jgi:hypothetical protein
MNDSQRVPQLPHIAAAIANSRRIANHSASALSDQLTVRLNRGLWLGAVFNDLRAILWSDRRHRRDQKARRDRARGHRKTVDAAVIRLVPSNITQAK